jgi:hypothetical protein
MQGLGWAEPARGMLLGAIPIAPLGVCLASGSRCRWNNSLSMHKHVLSCLSLHYLRLYRFVDLSDLLAELEG